MAGSTSRRSKGPVHWWQTVYNGANVVLMGFLVYHLVDSSALDKMDDEGHWGLFFIHHPWYMVTALVTVCLALEHVAGVRQCRARYCCVGGTTGEWGRRVHELGWATLWMVQMAVQLLLPREHRVYGDAAEWALAIYTFQWILLCGVVVVLTVERRQKAKEAAAAAAEGEEVLVLGTRYENKREEGN